MSSRATPNEIVTVEGIDWPNVRPRIEMLAEGGWIVVWTQDNSDGSFYGIFQQRYDAFGNAVGPSVRVNTQTMADQVTGDVAGLPDGGWLVAWHDLATGNVNFQRYDASGVPLGGETAINTTIGLQNYAPAITVLADGGWLIAWEHNGAGIRQQRYDADGARMGGETTVNSFAASVTEAQTVGLADGGWVVSWTWLTGTSNAAEIRMQRFDDAGNAVSIETTVNTTFANDQILSRLCALADGGWIVSWQGYDGFFSQVYFQRYSSDGVAFGGEVVVNRTSVGLGHFDADVAALADGGWVVTYKHDSVVDGIFQQRYDHNGLPVGGATRLDSGGASDLLTPQIVATPDGGWTTVWLESFGGNHAVLARHFANDIYGTTGADNMTGTHWNETLVGLAGNDVLDGAGGDDVMIGGYGDDTYRVGSVDDEVRELFGQGIDTVISLIDFSLLPSQAENLTLTGFGDNNGIGNALANIIIGTSGVNTLNGLNGNDTLDGGAGNDTLNGGAGNDLMSGGEGNDRLAGSSGRDTASYAAALAGVFVNLSTITAQDTVGAGLDTVLDTENLIGSAFNDTLTGNDADNVFAGGAGNDTMAGGNGVDTLDYGSAIAGVTVRLGVTGAQNTVGAGTDTISGFENVVGSAFNDTLAGSAGNNLFEGGAGHDRIDGNGGIDTVTYASAASAILTDLAIATAQNTFGAGLDTLSSIENAIGSAFNDQLLGSIGINQLEGGAGNDSLDGRDGADKLIGGLGIDVLTGGAGADRFIFDDGDSGRTDDTADAIIDFSQAQFDRVALSQIDANIAVAGDQAFSFIGAGAFTGVAGQLRQFTNGGLTGIAGDTNGDSQADFIIYLFGNYTLVSSDFIL